ncbi:hypothetical protein KR059_007346 [Drosophila kikkawai]|nr:hypothetical protein KR059_007346 [Drosophila kikkawai]
MLMAAKFRRKCSETKMKLRADIRSAEIMASEKPSLLKEIFAFAAFQQFVALQGTLKGSTRPWKYTIVRSVVDSIQISPAPRVTSARILSRVDSISAQKCLQFASSLASHLCLHSGERPFACEDCSKAFRTNGALVTHCRRHLRLIQHMCPHCKRGFLEASNLRRRLD